MDSSRRKFIKRGVSAAATLALASVVPKAGNADNSAAASPPAPPDRSIAPGPFKPNWESLQAYECPEWFRDAKFGIWAHWSAQCVPEQGDWYARFMYQQDSADYDFQCAHYGHPSKVGFKDIDHIWKADNWDPERLMELYVAAGAKYFMALANHHDNFDTYDSTYQPWNAVAIGPKKDIIRTWERVARKHGLRFAVSNHSSQSWHWFQVAYAHDTHGPLAGVPYDGHLTKEDGVGTWWEGLDPADLYTGQQVPIPSDIKTQAELDRFENGLNSQWSQPPPNDPAYVTKWFNRCKELLDKYEPDMIYFDDTVVPLGEAGLNIYAHFYNQSVRRNHGRTECVITAKGIGPDKVHCLVQDFERGRSDRVEPLPWQTDTCIGNWHYQRSLYLNHQYKTPEQVVKMLMDIVSKNGNLMLNIPVRGDGTIDPDEIEFLQNLAAWMKVNEEAIFGSRPWTISGEGPVRMAGGGFSEGGESRLTSADIRFTTKSDVLYATAMGWPDSGQITIRTLGKGAPGIVGDVSNVQLLGHGDVSFLRTAGGLVATMPSEKPCDYIYILKITGLDIAASKPVRPALPPAEPDSDGTFTLLPGGATLGGSGGLQLQSGGRPNIGFWTNPNDTIAWRIDVSGAGTYSVSAAFSAGSGSSLVELAVTSAGGVNIDSTVFGVPGTAEWNRFEDVNAPSIRIPAAGIYTLILKPADPDKWTPVNVASVSLSVSNTL